MVEASAAVDAEGERGPLPSPPPQAERRSKGRAAAPEACLGGDIRCVARPHGTVAPFRRSASPYFLEARNSWLWSAKPGRGLRRGNKFLFHLSLLEGRGSRANEVSEGGGGSEAGDYSVLSEPPLTHPSPPSGE